MKLALFTDTYEPQVNGVAKTLSRLTSFLQSQHVDVMLISPVLSQDGHSMQTCALPSMPFFLYPECRIAVPNKSALEKALHSFQPDLLHVATPFNTGWCGLHYGKKSGTPMVASYHTHFDKYLAYYRLDFFSPLLWKYMRWFHEPFQRIFVPSAETQSALSSHGFSNIHIWSRGVDCTQYSPSKHNASIREKYDIEEKYLFMFAGRLAPEKDLDTLTEIITSLPPPLQEEVHWIIVGDGPCFKEMKQRLRSSKATFTGYLSGEELASTYASSDLFVFPSSTETFGNVVLEAMASGTPALVADKGGVTGIVTHGETGMICESRNAQSFVESIQTVCAHKAFLEKMSTNARKYALSQSWSTILGGLLIQYEEVLFEKRKSYTA
ncbi:glycosyltransferase family 4 protein [Fictibacillus iocasae]|uniref:Glycosyltransferase family 4 protein n=1 Tax=Fictibacillus iocasae TaxID=2715437 RepID=A0ABW2NVM3_9BACL